MEKASGARFDSDPQAIYDVCHVDWEIAPIAPWIVTVDEFAAPDVGLDRTPQRFLKAGEELVSQVEGIGELRQQFVDA